jgi:hypothetical protein
MSYYNNNEILNLWDDNNQSNIVFDGIKSKPKFFYNDKTSAYGFLLYNEESKTIYLSFRGTNDIKDVYYDCELDLVSVDNILNIDNIKVHKGFLKQFKSLNEEIIKALSELEYNTIYINGHSLGGGIATIASLYYKIMFPEKKIYLHTFGSPRVGNKDFVKKIQDNIYGYYRVVNEVDPITTYPISAEYLHIGNCLILKSNGKVTITNKDTPYYYRLIVSFFHIDLLDHSLDGYIKNINKLLGNK